MTHFERVLELMRRGLEAMEAETPVGGNEAELDEYRHVLKAWEVTGKAIAVERPTKPETPPATPKSYCNFR